MGDENAWSASMAVYHMQDGFPLAYRLDQINKLTSSRVFVPVVNVHTATTSHI